MTQHIRSLSPARRPDLAPRTVFLLQSLALFSRAEHDAPSLFSGTFLIGAVMDAKLRTDQWSSGSSLELLNEMFSPPFQTVQ